MQENILKMTRHRTNSLTWIWCNMGHGQEMNQVDIMILILLVITRSCKIQCNSLFLMAILPMPSRLVWSICSYSHRFFHGTSAAAWKHQANEVTLQYIGKNIRTRAQRPQQSTSRMHNSGDASFVSYVSHMILINHWYTHLVMWTQRINKMRILKKTIIQLLG